MTDMVERVARAICLANTQGDEMWQAFVPEARAALEAMREPTEGMVRAGRDEYYGVSPFSARFAWIKIVDAALEGK